MAIRLWLTVLISLFVATSAHALPEICGNGLDDDGTGGDLACPDPDKDADGHLAGADCDDNDRMIFPGVVTAKGCSAGQYRTCQPNGTYTACSATTLCEKTGSGRCFYIDCGTGSNSNAGTFAAPWKDFRMVSYFQNAGSRPAGWQALVPGDVIYLKGTGACTTAYDPGPDLQNDVMFYAYGPSMSGTATAPITIKRYPGSTAVIRPPFTATYDGTAFMNISASYYKYEDLEITQGFSRQIALFDNSNDVEITRTYIHDNNGAREINPAAIYSAENARLKIHHNRFVDNCDR